jgi:hypothetical protein
MYPSPHSFERTIMKALPLSLLAAAPCFLLCFQGYAQTAEPAAAPCGSQDLRDRMAALHQAISAEVGTPAADDVSQCGVIAFGAKACGGPQGYIVYSRKVSNEQRLESLADQYAQLEREWNHRNRVISTCSIAMPPTPVIVNGQCQAGSNVHGGQATDR